MSGWDYPPEEEELATRILRQIFTNKDADQFWESING